MKIDITPEKKIVCDVRNSRAIASENLDRFSLQVENQLDCISMDILPENEYEEDSCVIIKLTPEEAEMLADGLMAMAKEYRKIKAKNNSENSCYI